MRTLDEREVDAHVARIAEVGYTVVPDAIEPALVDALDAALREIERQLRVRPGANLFEGEHTVRIYNLLAHAGPFVDVPAHANVLPIVERVLDAGCLISSLSSIAIDPGEDAQPIHADDQAIPLPKPHPAIVCNSMWAITDFTEANGATRVVPGSHLRDSPAFGVHHDSKRGDSIPAVMTRGSVLVWHGSLWHGGGANRTAARRTGIAMNYCAGFIRQQENQQLGVPRALARSFPPRVQALMGYVPYRDLIGHIDKRSPMELLGGGEGFRSIWDR